MKESKEAAREACASRRLGQRLLVVPLPPAGPRLVHKNEPRPTPGLLRISYRSRPTGNHRVVPLLGRRCGRGRRKREGNHRVT
jgi:hypothetical protein